MTNMSRPKSAKTKKSPYFVIFAVLLFITTGWVAMGVIWEYSAHLIASQGQVATATVTGKVMHPAGQGGYTKTSYEQDFAFTTTDGKRIEGKTGVTADYWDQIKPGDTFKVTYAADQPGTYHIGTDTSTMIGDCIFLGIVVIWLVVMRLTIRALHRQPTPRTASAVAPDTSDRCDAASRGETLSEWPGARRRGLVLSRCALFADRRSQPCGRARISHTW